MNESRRGISLIETLIVISIIMLMMGFLLGAIQNVRQAAKRAECRNNLKQLGLAANTYSTMNQDHLPKFMYSSYINNRDQFTGTVFFALLPYMEQQYLYNAGLAEPNVYDNRPAPLSWKGSITISGQSTTVLGVFGWGCLCPSDNSVSPEDFKVPGSDPRPGAISYAANFMLLGEMFTISESPDHPYHSDAPAYTVVQIPDGTSQTMLFAEKIASANSSTLNWIYTGGAYKLSDFKIDIPVGIPYVNTPSCPGCKFCQGQHCPRCLCADFPFPLTETTCLPISLPPPPDWVQPCTGTPIWVPPSSDCSNSPDCTPSNPPVVPIGGWGCLAEASTWKFGDYGEFLANPPITPLPAFNVCNPGVKYANRFASPTTPPIPAGKPIIFLHPKDVRAAVWEDVFFRAIALSAPNDPISSRWEVLNSGVWVTYVPKPNVPTNTSFVNGDTILAFKLSPNQLNGMQLRASFTNSHGTTTSEVVKINPQKLAPRKASQFPLPWDPDNYYLANVPLNSNSYVLLGGATGWSQDRSVYNAGTLAPLPYTPVGDLLPPQYVGALTSYSTFDPHRAGSMHRGSCHVVNVDGSVHNVLEGIDPKVWVRLCRPDDGEVIETPDW